MPAAYRASKPSLYGGVGSPNAPTGGVDVAAAIDALSGGASSLIHSAMLRQQNERAVAAAAEERTYQRQRDTAEDERKNREFEFKQKDAERDFMLKGGVPAHDEMLPTPTTAQVQAPVIPPIRRAMTRPNRGLPAPSFTPMGVQGAPTTAPLPASKLTEQRVPEHVDARRSVAYQQATDVAGVRAQVQSEAAAERAANQAKLLERRIQAGKESAVYAQHGRIELEKLRQSGRNSGIRRGMTPTAASGIAERIADGIISSHEGDREAAFEWLNSDDPEAVGLRKFAAGDDKSPGLPLSWGTYLDNARAKWAKTATAQSLSFQHGPMGDEPAAATKKVNETRKSVTPARINRTPEKLPAGAESLATPAAITDATSIFRRTAPAAAAAVPNKKAAAPADTVTDDQFTDTEIDAAIAAGHESDADVRAYILAERKKKKPSKPKG